MLDRRSMLAGSAVLAAAPLAPAIAQAPAPGPEDKIRAAARDARRRLDYSGGRFSGAAYDWLAGQGREAAFFLLGEEHGIAENPKLAAQLFRDLVPAEHPPEGAGQLDHRRSAVRDARIPDGRHAALG